MAPDTDSDRELSAEQYADAIETMADEIGEHLEELGGEPEQYDVHAFVDEEVNHSDLIRERRYYLDALAHADGEVDEWHYFVADPTDHWEHLKAMTYDVVRADLVAELETRGVLGQ